MHSTLLVQLSDLHVLAPGKVLSGMVETDALLARCLAAVQALDPRPDAVLLSGDLVDSGHPAEYQRLRELLAAIDVPVYVIPGNHDALDALRHAFRDHDYLPPAGPLRWCVQVGALRLIGLDSSIPGEAGGRIDADTLDWLDQTLAAAPDQPTVVALHHPPFDSGIRHMDEIGLRDPAALAAVIRKHAQVERVLSGHMHRPMTARFGGTVASTCPSSAHQIEFNLQAAHPGGFILEPPAFQVHRWDPAAGLVSHLVPVGDFSGPHRFHD